MLRHPASLVPLATHDPTLMALVERPVSPGVIQHIADEIPQIIQGAMVAPARTAMSGALTPPTSPEDGGAQLQVIYPPHIPTLRQFITQLVERSNIQLPTLLCSMVYLYRLKARLPTVARRLICAHHCIFLAVVIVAAKYLNDSSLKNKYWVRYGGLFSQSDVNLMERQLLMLLDYDLRVDEPELFDYAQPFLVGVNWKDLCLPPDTFIKTPDVLAEQQRYARSARRRAKLRAAKKLSGAGARGIMSKNQASSVDHQVSSPLVNDSASPPISPSVASSALLDQPSQGRFHHIQSCVPTQLIRRCPDTPLSFISWDDIPLADDAAAVSNALSNVRHSSTSTIVSPGSSFNPSTAPTSRPASSVVPTSSQAVTSDELVDFLAVSDSDGPNLIDAAERKNSVPDRGLLDDLSVRYTQPTLAGSMGSPSHAAALTVESMGASPASPSSIIRIYTSFSELGRSYNSIANCPNGGKVKYRHSFGASTRHTSKPLASRPGGQRRSMPFLRYLFPGSSYSQAEDACVDNPSSPSTPSATTTGNLTSPPKSGASSTRTSVFRGQTIPTRTSSKPCGEVFSTARSVTTVGLSPPSALAIQVPCNNQQGVFMGQSDSGTAVATQSSSAHVGLSESASVTQVQPSHAEKAKLVRVRSSTIKGSNLGQSQPKHSSEQTQSGYSLLTFSPSKALRRVTSFSLRGLSGGHA